MASQRGRWLAFGAILSLLVVAVLGVVVLSSSGEESRVSELLAAAKAYDNDRLATFLVPSARTNDKTADSRRALSLALVGSTVECLAAGWGTAFTKTSGVAIDFTGTKIATAVKSGNLAVVEAQGALSLSAPNDPIVDRDAKRLCQRDFDVFVSLARATSGDWYIIPRSEGLPLPSAKATGNPLAGLATPTATLLSPTPTPTPVPTLATPQPPSISNVRVSTVGANGATINWDTSVPATTQVEYGTTPAYGSASDLDLNLVVSHSRTLTGLRPTTLYHLRVKSIVRGEVVFGSDVTFTTTAPQVRLVPGTYPQSVSAECCGGWRMVLRAVTVREDQSIQMDFDVTVGPDGSPWGARASYLQLTGGQRLVNIESQGVFFPGGGRGTTVKTSLAFPPGLGGYQPYIIKICNPFSCDWPEISGPSLPERPL